MRTIDCNSESQEYYVSCDDLLRNDDVKKIMQKVARQGGGVAVAWREVALYLANRLNQCEMALVSRCRCELADGGKRGSGSV